MDGGFLRGFSVRSTRKVILQAKEIFLNINLLLLNNILSFNIKFFDEI